MCVCSSFSADFWPHLCSDMNARATKSFSLSFGVCVPLCLQMFCVGPKDRLSDGRKWGRRVCLFACSHSRVRPAWGGDAEVISSGIFPEQDYLKQLIFYNETCVSHYLALFFKSQSRDVWMDAVQFGKGWDLKDASAEKTNTSNINTWKSSALSVWLIQCWFIFDL